MKDILNHFVDCWLKASEEQKEQFRAWLDEIHLQVDGPNQDYERRLKSGSVDLVVIGKKMLADAILGVETQLTYMTERSPDS